MNVFMHVTCVHFYCDDFKCTFGCTALCWLSRCKCRGCQVLRHEDEDPQTVPGRYLDVMMEMHVYSMGGRLP